MSRRVVRFLPLGITTAALRVAMPSTKSGVCSLVGDESGRRRPPGTSASACVSDVGVRTWAPQCPGGQPEPVRPDVDLGSEPATTAPQRLFLLSPQSRRTFCAPAAHGCARIAMGSRSRYRRSGSGSGSTARARHETSGPSRSKDAGQEGAGTENGPVSRVGPCGPTRCVPHPMQEKLTRVKLAKTCALSTIVIDPRGSAARLLQGAPQHPPALPVVGCPGAEGRIHSPGPQGNAMNWFRNLKVSSRTGLSSGAYRADCGRRIGEDYAAKCK
ncbi:hypothetical protein GobsT_62720 [Gemmata obscuriglobus]|nr:hypothetical protein GobsT_62720 [Gemmata obscuriglobus]VTS10792.1 unnamed protein product [Gemmata obscuriglobus UQM 2246]